MSLNVYLLFNGECADAMNYYKEALGGQIESIQRFGDAPMASSEVQKDQVMHGVMNILGQKVMFSDSGGEEKHRVTFGNNFSIALDYKDEAAMDTAFHAMSKGGQVTMPLQDTFWGARFGMCKDKFGVNWMFNMDKPKN